MLLAVSLDPFVEPAGWAKERLEGADLASCRRCEAFGDEDLTSAIENGSSRDEFGRERRRIVGREVD